MKYPANINLFINSFLTNKITFLIIIFLISNFCVFAEDEVKAASNSKTAISAGPEWNMNSRENFAAGAVLAFDFNITSVLAIGFNTTFSSNFSELFVIEPGFLFRWYFFSSVNSKQRSVGLFAQADAGASIVFDNTEVSLMPLGGLRGGLRLPLGDVLFIEPFGRIGYPFAFGFGVTAGIRIPSRAEAGNITQRRTQLASEITAVIEEYDIKDVYVQTTDEGVMITLSNIMFRADSAVLPDAERIKLREIARVLSSINNVKIKVAGHATTVGTLEYQLELSGNRARSVADYLISLGAVEAVNVTITGYGSSRLIADDSTPQGMAANRRVEIIILE
jgi:outer membrane protein OmpA-like peptidoglycan-associated protein